MTRRARIVWTVVAAVFTAVNAVGAVLAAAEGEPAHAGVHVLLTVLGAYFTWRLARSATAERSIEAGVGAAEEIPNDRLSQLERSVDAVAIEVERIGEGQRFMTKVLTEKDHSRAEDAASRAPRPPKTPPNA